MNNVKARKLLAILNHPEQSFARLNNKGLWWIGFNEYPNNIIKFERFQGRCTDQVILQYFLSHDTIAPDGIVRNNKSFWVFYMILDNTTSKMIVDDKIQITRDQAISIINWYEKKRMFMVNDEGYNYNQFTSTTTLPTNFTFVKGYDGKDYRLFCDGTLRHTINQPVSRPMREGDPGFGTADFILEDSVTCDEERYEYLDWPVVKIRVDGKLYNRIGGKLYSI